MILAFKYFQFLKNTKIRWQIMTLTQKGLQNSDQIISQMQHRRNTYIDKATPIPMPMTPPPAKVVGAPEVSNFPVCMYTDSDTWPPSPSRNETEDSVAPSNSVSWKL